MPFGVGEDSSMMIKEKTTISNKSPIYLFILCLPNRSIIILPSIREFGWASMFNGRTLIKGKKQVIRNRQQIALTII